MLYCTSFSDKSILGLRYFLPLYLYHRSNICVFVVSIKIARGYIIFFRHPHISYSWLCPLCIPYIPIYGLFYAHEASHCQVPDVRKPPCGKPSHAIDHQVMTWELDSGNYPHGWPYDNSYFQLTGMLSPHETLGHWDVRFSHQMDCYPLVN